jgi:hypothetical protein
MTTHPGLVHPPSISVGIVAATSMQQAAVVPDNKITLTPLVTVH